jgi:hypothetical protein
VAARPDRKPYRTARTANWLTVGKALRHETGLLFAPKETENPDNLSVEVVVDHDSWLRLDSSLDLCVGNCKVGSVG